MHYRWVHRALKQGATKNTDRQAIFQEIEKISGNIAKQLGVSRQIAHLCALRGSTTPEEANSFLSAGLGNLPNPFLMKGMEEGATRIAQAIMDSEWIEVHTDYDVDGQSSSAILTEFLKYHKASVRFFVPDRHVDGYGLSKEAIKRAANNGVSLIVSADCGISNMEEAALAQSLGIDLIITDHHLPPEKGLPRAYAVINPHQNGCKFPQNDKNLCGAGVAFYLALAVRQKLREAGFYLNVPEPDAKKLLDMVAVATVADIVPLVGANRILTRAGLKVIDAELRPGIKALKDVAGVKRASSGTIGFQLAPRLNAVGRLADAGDGVRLLLSQKKEDAETLATKLNEMNDQRRQIEERILKDALKIIEDNNLLSRKCLVIAGQGWDSGVIGIVASTLVELYHRPTVMIAINEKGVGKGSARSIEGFHLQQSFTRCGDLLLGYGGHSMAAGMSISQEMISDFTQRFEEDVNAHLREEDLVPILYYDMTRELKSISVEGISELEMLEPYGMKNPTPIFCSAKVIPGQIRILKEKHLSFIPDPRNSRSLT